MKKIYIVFTCLIVLGITLSMFDYAYTNSSGAPAGRTGALGEQTCNSCHNNTLQSGAPGTGTVENTLTLNGAPASSYVPGTSYTVVLGITTAVPGGHGFQIMAVNSANSSVGTFTAGTRNRVVSSGGRSYVTHSARYTISTTSFTWVAPAAGTGLVTFYAITYTGNSNGSTASILRQASFTVTEAASSPAAPTITASGPLTFCQGGSVVLTSSAATSYLWSNGATSQSITVNTSGSFTCQVSNGGPVSPASAATVVTVNPAPAQPDITDSGTRILCHGRSITLTSTVTTGNVWSNGATSQSIVLNSPGSYTVQIVQNGCTSSVSNSVVITAGNYIFTPVNASFCTGSSYNFNDRILNQEGTYNDTIPSRLPFACDSIVSLNLIVEALPVAPTLVFEGGALTASSQLSSFKWFKDGILIPGEITNTFVPSSSGSYTVLAVSSNGCESAPSAAVVVNSLEGKVLSNVLAMYPNPAIESLILNIKGLSPQTVLLQIQSLTGSLVRVVPIKITGNENGLNLNVESLSSGSYFIIGQAKEGVLKTRFVKQ